MQLYNTTKKNLGKIEVLEETYYLEPCQTSNLQFLCEKA